MFDLKTQLTTLGMSDKEAQVYLAMLETGPSSVQDIAKKAGVNRATTYVMLEALKRRGLVSSVEHGKKTHFTAESPEHLMAQVERERSTVEEKLTRLQTAMPDFMSLFNAIEDKPKVRFFEGLEGISACREAMMQFKQDEVGRAFIKYDQRMLELANYNQTQRFKLINEMSRVKVLYALDPGTTLPAFDGRVELREVPAGIPIFHGELDFLKDAIVVFIYQSRPLAVIIESAEVAQMFKSFFELAWLAAAKKT